MERLDAKEALKRISQFEDCTLPIQQWTHYQHLLTGLYVFLNYREKSLGAMRERIWRYNEIMGNGNDNRGYHETLTLFWLWMIMQFCKAKNITQFNNDSVAQLYDYQLFTDKKIVEKYYHIAILYSPYSRKNVQFSDLQDMDDVEFFEF